MAKVRATFSLGKLSRKLEKTVVTGLNTMMNHLNKEIQEKLEAGVDINDKSYKKLSPSTEKQRENKTGYYGKEAKKDGGTLNWSGNMRQTTKTLAVPGPAPVAKLEMVGKLKHGKNKGEHYGAFHNEGGGNLPKREWFGMTKSMKPGGKARNTALGIIKLGIIKGWKK